MYGLPDLFMYLSRKTVTKALVTFATLILSDPCFLGKAHSTTFNLLVSQCIGRLFEKLLIQHSQMSISCFLLISECPPFKHFYYWFVCLLSLLCRSEACPIKLDQENFKIFIILWNCQNRRNNT